MDREFTQKFRKALDLLLARYPTVDASEVEDIIGDAVLSALCIFHGREHFDDGMWGWLVKRAKWRIVDSLRHCVRFQVAPDLAVSDDADPALICEHSEVFRLVQEVLRNDKDFFVLWQWATGHDTSSIASELGLTTGAVRKRIERALKRLRKKALMAFSDTCRVLASSTVKGKEDGEVLHARSLSDKESKKKGRKEGRKEGA